MIKTEHFGKVEVNSSEELRQWLLENYTQKESVWLVTYKKSVQRTFSTISMIQASASSCDGSNWLKGTKPERAGLRK